LLFSEFVCKDDVGCRNCGMVLVCFDTFLFWIFWQNMLQTGMIIGGWDKYEGGKIYGVPLGGTLLELPFTIGGV